MALCGTPDGLNYSVQWPLSFPGIFACLWRLVCLCLCWESFHIHSNYFNFLWHGQYSVTKSFSCLRFLYDSGRLRLGCMWGRVAWTRAEEEQLLVFTFLCSVLPSGNRWVSLRGSLFHFPLLKVILLITTSKEKFLDYTFPKQINIKSLKKCLYLKMWLKLHKPEGESAHVSLSWVKSWCKNWFGSYPLCHVYLPLHFRLLKYFRSHSTVFCCVNWFNPMHWYLSTFDVVGSIS